MGNDQKPTLEVGEVLAAGFKPIKSKFWTLLVMVGTPYLLAILFFIGGGFWIYYNAFGPLFMELIEEQKHFSDPARLWPAFWGYLGIMIVSFIPSALSSAALFRFNTGKGLRGQFFAFRFGADEVRLYIMLWLVLIFTVFLPTGLIAALITLAVKMDAKGLALGLMLAAFFILPVIMIFIGVRFSLAFAQTFAEKKLRLLGSWRLTRGHFWTLFLSYAVLIVIFGLLSALVSTPANILFYSQPQTGWLGDANILEGLPPEDILTLFKETFLSKLTLIAFFWALLAGSIVNVLQTTVYNGASLFAYQQSKAARSFQSGEGS